MEDEVFKITPDKERANDLCAMAKDRLEIMGLLPRNKPYKLIEEYYEIIKELLTAIMYIDGCKTLSHVALINYFAGEYDEIDETGMRLIDSLRKLRHGIDYYGQQVKGEFLVNNEAEIKKIISILLRLVGKKLGAK